MSFQGSGVCWCQVPQRAQFSRRVVSSPNLYPFLHGGTTRSIPAPRFRRKYAKKVGEKSRRGELVSPTPVTINCRRSMHYERTPRYRRFNLRWAAPDSAWLTSVFYGSDGHRCPEWRQVGSTSEFRGRDVIPTAKVTEGSPKSRKTQEPFALIRSRTNQCRWLGLVLLDLCL